MNTIDFVYLMGSVRFVTADNDGYKYQDTGNEVEAGVMVYEGQKISFDEFVDWATESDHYLLDCPDERVVKIYRGDNGNSVLCADGFFDQNYLPWDEFEKYSTVIVLGYRFILIDEKGETIELTALAPSVPVI